MHDQARGLLKSDSRLRGNDGLFRRFLAALEMTLVQMRQGPDDPALGGDAVNDAASVTYLRRGGFK